jgi:hypothetical protein
VPLGGLAGAAAVEVDPGLELDPHETAANKARPAAKVTQTRAAICISCPRSRRK